MSAQTLLVAGGFTPVTNTYNSGTAATETIPAGASKVVITVWSSGAGGATTGDMSNKGNSGSGSQVIKTVTGLVGGQTFTYTVGAQVSGHSGGGTGNGTTGNDSTVVSGTDTHSISLTASGGVAATTANNGGAASATGGDTNNAGNAGTITHGGSAPNGGAGGTGQSAGSVNGAGPGGGGGSGDTTGSIAGGNGAGGTISFAYT